jgi:hypothetical protein
VKPGSQLQSADTRDALRTFKLRVRKITDICQYCGESKSGKMWKFLGYMLTDLEKWNK